eukprot:TRINITY_DN3874_c0_g1_i3.p1 TRINITY_DN3874_c0_g1~~TRINITY_DN3874_c0_g1_i3.p1  ORF type:complete len:365 (-),score=41.86 TRINITY_DN3874_c0_g1_i3:72-1136(-)
MFKGVLKCLNRKTAKTAACFSVAALLTTYASSTFLDKYELSQVHVISRHGARTPLLSSKLPEAIINLPWQCEDTEDPHLEIIKKDERFPYNEYKLANLHTPNRPQIFGKCVDGQLTTMGTAQMVNFGRFLRERYINQYPFLSDKSSQFNKEIADQLYIRSTNMSRTILTARSIMHGLLSIDSRTKFEVPLQIDVLPTPDENMYPRSACKAFLALKKKYRMDVRPQEIEEEVVRIFENVNSSERHYWTTRGASGSTNNLNTLDVHGFPFPEGITYEHYERVKKLSGEMYSIVYSTDQINRISLGRFLDQVNQNIKKADTKNENDPKFFLYSGHDNTVAPLLNMFKVCPTIPFIYV